MRLLSFYKGLSWLIILNVLIKPVWIFGIDRVVQNRVGYEGYGMYFSYLGLCMSLAFLADAGLTGLMSRELAKGSALNIKTIFRLKVFLSLLYGFIICVIALITDVKDWSVLIPVIIIQILTSYLLFYRAIITAQQEFKRDAWISVLDKALMVISCGLLLYASLPVEISLHVFLYLQITCLVIAVMAAALLKKTITNEQAFIKISSLIKKSVPFMALILLMSIHNRIDAFLLGRFHVDGAYQAGVYAAAYRLLDAGNIVGYMMATYLVPFAARNLGDKKLITEISFTLRQTLLFGSVVLVALVAVYSNQLPQILYPSLAPSDPNILLICMATLPAYYLTHIYGSLLTAQGALRVFIFIVALSVLVNLVLNFFLISIGAIGCCIAALISQAICAIGCMVVCKKEMKVGLKPVSLLWVAGVGLLYFVLFYFVRVETFSLQISLAIAVLLTALLMFAWRQRIKQAIAYY